MNTPPSKRPRHDDDHSDNKLKVMRISCPRCKCKLDVKYSDAANITVTAEKVDVDDKPPSSGSEPELSWAPVALFHSRGREYVTDEHSVE